MLSGLWHQRHDRLHPLKNTVVRMPRPVLCGHPLYIEYPCFWNVLHTRTPPELQPVVCFSGDNLILYLSANRCKISAVSGNADEKVTIILGMFLRIPQHVGIDHIDLQAQYRRFSHILLKMSGTWLYDRRRRSSEGLNVIVWLAPLGRLFRYPL